MNWESVVRSELELAAGSDCQRTGPSDLAFLA